MSKSIPIPKSLKTGLSTVSYRQLKTWKFTNRRTQEVVEGSQAYVVPYYKGGVFKIKFTKAISFGGINHKKNTSGGFISFSMIDDHQVDQTKTLIDYLDKEVVPKARKALHIARTPLGVSELEVEPLIKYGELIPPLDGEDNHYSYYPDQIVSKVYFANLRHGRKVASTPPNSVVDSEDVVYDWSDLARKDIESFTLVLDRIVLTKKHTLAFRHHIDNIRVNTKIKTTAEEDSKEIKNSSGTNSGDETEVFKEESSEESSEDESKDASQETNQDIKPAPLKVHAKRKRVEENQTNVNIRVRRSRRKISKNVVQ